MFSQVSVHNRPHGYSFTACVPVGTPPTGMLSCFRILFFQGASFSLHVGIYGNFLSLHDSILPF